ncbi:MAG TPA: class I SAM-dependent methyltransferase [Stellaceae bacterium]|nr:class I SAM-dependent methyltransferase [Stellaceae bacterium]
MADRVAVEEYLDLLRDPSDGGRLLLRDGVLLGATSGLVYDFVGAFPDLRPGHGRPGQKHADPAGADAPFPAAAHRRVLDHYDDKPCNNYLALDNIPLGRYLRDAAYDSYFAGVRLAVEVGCGKGAVARAFKEHRGITPFCIDLAYGSLRQVREKPIEADGVLGSNLRLPLADNAADMVISYGVIHHTPDPLRCFMELTRILKPGGLMLFSVYNWENLYRSLYFFLSPPLKATRHLFGIRLGDAILKATVFLPYHLALWIVIGSVQGRWSFPNLSESYEQFADFFLTPIARFYHSGELRTLGDAFGLDVVEQDAGGWPKNGFAHFVWYRKR